MTMDKTHNYAINIAWSAEDDCWVALVPELDGCAAHGDTPEEALAEARIAIENWLDEAQRIGAPVPVEAPGVAHLAKAGEVLNVAACARLLGLNTRTLASRIANGTPLSPRESENLKEGLRARGIAFV